MSIAVLTAPLYLASKFLVVTEAMAKHCRDHLENNGYTPLSAILFSDVLLVCTDIRTH